MAIRKPTPKSMTKPTPKRKLKSSSHSGTAGKKILIADPALKPAGLRKKLGVTAVAPSAPTGVKVDKVLAALVAEVAPSDVAVVEGRMAVASAEPTTEPTTEAATGATSVPTTEPASETAADATVDMLRKKDFLQRLSDRTGMRKNQIKPVMEAVLAELGDALIKGESLNLPPLGKLSVNRSISQEKADVVICKLRRAKAPVASDVLEAGAEKENAISPLAVPQQ